MHLNRKVRRRRHIKQDANVAAEGEGAGAMVERVRQLFCGLHGHDNLLQFEQDRMFLKCVSCGHESPGWELGDTPPPEPIHDTAAHRAHALMHADLIGVRRVA
jgi:hypothetical protein